MTSWVTYDPFYPPPYLQSPNPRRRPPWQTTRALLQRAQLPTQTLRERHQLLRLLQFKITQKKCRLGRERQNASLHCWSRLAIVNWKSLSEKKNIEFELTPESSRSEVARCDRALQKNRDKVFQLETEFAKIVLSTGVAQQNAKRRFEVTPAPQTTPESEARLERAKTVLMADSLPPTTTPPCVEVRDAEKHSENAKTEPASKLDPCSICQEEEAESLCVTCATPICVWCGHWYGASYPSICDECYPESKHLMCKNSTNACENSARGKCSACSGLVCYECGVWKDPEVWCLDCRRGQAFGI